MLILARMVGVSRKLKIKDEIVKIKPGEEIRCTTCNTSDVHRCDPGNPSSPFWQCVHHHTAFKVAFVDEELEDTPKSLTALAKMLAPVYGRTPRNLYGHLKKGEVLGVPPDADMTSKQVQHQLRLVLEHTKQGHLSGPVSSEKQKILLPKGVDEISIEQADWSLDPDKPVSSQITMRYPAASPKNVEIGAVTSGNCVNVVHNVPEED